MHAELVKMDVAAADLGVGVRIIERMVDGGDLVLKPLVWVFDFATDLERGARRELRFWRPELAAHAGGNPRRYGGYELPHVLKRILPEKRANFHAGEVDQLFQIRHNTRLEYAELNGQLNAGRNFYSRAALAEFLERRWLGAIYQRKKVLPRAAATTSADTHKQTTHAAPSLP